MSIVAYYARLTPLDLDALRADPERFWRLPPMPWDLVQDCGPAASECHYADKDWQVLSWLCSEGGRAEERDTAVRYRALSNPAPRDADAFSTALRREAEALGFQYVDPGTLPPDPVLRALKGSREAEGSTIPHLGLHATVFTPADVRLLSVALDALDETWLGARFDVHEMRVLDFPADCEETELDEFFLPQLARIKALYGRAARAGQNVVVVMS